MYMLEQSIRKPIYEFLSGSKQKGKIGESNRSWVRFQVLAPLEMDQHPSSFFFFFLLLLLLPHLLLISDR
jgi:hypothetical protein